MSAKPVQYDCLNYNLQSVAASRTTGCYSHTQPSLRFPARGTRSTVAYIGWQRPQPSRRGEGFVAGTPSTATSARTILNPGCVCRAPPLNPHWQIAIVTF